MREVGVCVGSTEFDFAVYGFVRGGVFAYSDFAGLDGERGVVDTVSAETAASFGADGGVVGFLLDVVVVGCEVGGVACFFFNWSASTEASANDIGDGDAVVVFGGDGVDAQSGLVFGR